MTGPNSQPPKPAEPSNSHCSSQLLFQTHRWIVEPILWVSISQKCILHLGLVKPQVWVTCLCNHFKSWWKHITCHQLPGPKHSVQAFHVEVRNTSLFAWHLSKDEKTRLQSNSFLVYGGYNAVELKRWTRIKWVSAIANRFLLLSAAVMSVKAKCLYILGTDSPTQCGWRFLSLEAVKSTFLKV